MYKSVILSVAVGSCLFAGTGSDTVNSNNKANFEGNQYCWAEDSSSDNYKVEARKRGKGHRSRRRGGSGLR